MKQKGMPEETCINRSTIGITITTRSIIIITEAINTIKIDKWGKPPLFNIQISMKILIFSDSHGDTKRMIKALKTEREVHFIAHLGDYYEDLDNALQSVDLHLPVISVCGNMDHENGFFRRPSFEEHVFCGKKALFLHGNTFARAGEVDFEFVKREYGKYDLVLFGHTHTQLLFADRKPVLFNPGTISKGQYGVVTITENSILCEHKQK